MNLSPKQKKAIAQSNRQINIWHGAVRSGKTFSSLIRFLIEIDEAPPGEMVVIARDAFAFRRNILPLLIQLVGPDVKYTEGKGLLEIWGRKIHVVGAHDTRSEGKLRGATFVGAYVDEATLIPQSTWIVLLQRCAMGGAKIFATTNPDSPSHWLKTGYLNGNNPDVYECHFDMFDNPALTTNEREYLQRQHKGLWYRRFVEGQWVLAEGSVFDFFEENVHTIAKPPTNAKYYLVGVDVGFNNPTAFTMVGFNDDVSPALWVEQEYIFNQKESDSPKTGTELALDLVNFVSTRSNVRCVYIDPAALSFKMDLRRCGLGVPIRDGNNDVLEGIRTMSTLMGSGDLKILRSCRKLIAEVQGYCWDSKAGERGYDAPIKKNDHLTDSLRYIIFSHFGEKVSIKQQQVKEESCRTLGFQSLQGQRQSGFTGPKMIQTFDTSGRGSIDNNRRSNVF